MNKTNSYMSQSSAKLQKIMQINDPNVQENVKDRIKQKLIQDAQYLIQKKSKQKQRKIRVQNVEDKLEKLRQQKLKAMNDKKSKSEQLMEKNREIINKKFKQQEQYFKQILDRVQKKDRQHIENALSKQKQLVKLTSTLKHNKTNHSNKFLSNSTMTGQSSRMLDQSNVDQKLRTIQHKTNKAQKLHEAYNKLVVDRLRQKSENISQIHQKAINMSMNEQQLILNNCCKKAQSIQIHHETLKSLRQKKMLQRKQSLKYRIDKCNQNLRNYTYRQQQKYIQLQSKFDRKFSPKQYKNTKLQKYWQLWQQNSKQIEIQKQEDASKILQKHQQITQQNKVYKQKKQKLLQALKHI